MSKILVAIAAVTLVATRAAALDEVVYPGDDERYGEYIALLRKALDETTRDFGPYIMRPASLPMNEARFLLEARTGRLVNLVWSATSIEKERLLRPIRIPLGKGILSYRILFIPASMQAQFDRVHSLEDLRRFRFCLGPGWGEIPIYRSAGLQVDIAEYDRLLAMVEAGRCDAFSRGINEIFSEASRIPNSLTHVTVDRSLLLYYRFPFYFFVTPSNTVLAQRLETGLRRMLDDGTFDQIFWNFNGDAIRRAEVERRTVIELTNPGLPPTTPTDDSRLWFVPGDAGAASHVTRPSGMLRDGQGRCVGACPFSTDSRPRIKKSSP